MKKIYILSFGLLFSVAAAANFIDRAEFPSWAEDSIEVVQEADVMTGFGDGSFRASQKLNRAEAVTLLLRAKKMQDVRPNGNSRFADVPGESWFAKAVAVAEDNGWLTGKADGKFHPGDTLNRAEFSALIDRAFDLEARNEDALPFDDVAEGQWFYEPVKVLYDRGLLRNALNNSFRPEYEVTRAEAAWVFAKILTTPALNGEAGSNDFSNIVQIDNRRVAIKPKDFNPNKQSVDVVKKELLLTSTVMEAAVEIMRGDEEWTTVGSVRISNNLEGAGTLESVVARLRFDSDQVGPEGNFEARLTGPSGFEKIAPVSSGGESLFAGLDLAVDAGDQKVYWLSYRAVSEQSYFAQEGFANVVLNSAEGQYVGVSSAGENLYKIAPIGYDERMIGRFMFKLK